MNFEQIRIRFIRNSALLLFLADTPDHLEVKQRLREQLEEYLTETGDPRSEGKSPWDDYRLDK